MRLLFALAAAILTATILSRDAPAWSGLLNVLVATGAPSGECSLLPFDEFVLAGRAVVLGLSPADPPSPAALIISRTGTITAVIPISEAAAAADLGRAAAIATGRRYPSPRLRLAPPGSIIAPAAVDAHVHANDPGRAGWEGLESATRAAAAGGVGTVIDMPLNSHPSATSAAVLGAKVEAAAAAARRWRRGGRLTVDVGFWGGLVPANAGDHAELRAMADAGALGFKAFLAPSGIPDFPNASLGDVAAALPFLMRAGLPLLVHAELVGGSGGGGGGGGGVGGDAGDGEATAPPPDLAAWEASRPPAWEVAAVAGLVEVLAAAAAASTTTPKPGFRVHVAHVGTPAVLPLLAAARAAGLPISGEAVPHALGGLPYPAPVGPPRDALWKCAPPLRGPAAAAGLWAGLLAGDSLTTIGSDHSPAPPAMKTGVPFGRAWGGVAGLQFSLPASWTAARRHAPRPVTPAHLAAWLATKPAELAGLTRKGRIAAGWAADLAVWAPTLPADTRAAACHHRHPGACPYVGLPLIGRVLETYVRGRLVFEAEGGGGGGQGGRFARAACGKVVLRQGREAAQPRVGLAGSAAAATAAAGLDEL